MIRLTWSPRVSVMADARPVSEPVPEVVGTATTGAMPGMVHPFGQIAAPKNGAADERGSEEFVDALPNLADDRIGVEGLIEIRDT